MKITTEGVNRFAKMKSIALSALAVAALASTPALAGNNDEEELKFDMVRNPGLNAAFPNFLPNARGRVKIESAGPVEIMDVKVEGLPPNTDFDFFVIQVPKSGRISGLLNFLLAYFSVLWKKELHVAAGDLSGTKDIA